MAEDVAEDELMCVTGVAGVRSVRVTIAASTKPPPKNLRRNDVAGTVRRVRARQTDRQLIGKKCHKRFIGRFDFLAIRMIGLRREQIIPICAPSPSERLFALITAFFNGSAQRGVVGWARKSRETQMDEIVIFIHELARKKRAVDVQSFVQFSLVLDYKVFAISSRLILPPIRGCGISSH